MTSGDSLLPDRTLPDQSPVDETEQRIMPSPARGAVIALGLIAVSVALVGIAYAVGWFSSSHLAARAAHLAVRAAQSPAGDPVQLLARIGLAIGVICVLASLAGVLCRRIGQPPVAGEIVAGLILGASVLNAVAPGVHHAIFAPQVMPYVNVAAQAGLAIFMFTVGAEFNASLLRRQRGVISTASLAMMAAPFALGVVVAVPLFSSFAHPPTAAIPFVVFIGAALSVTAFPVLARIVRDVGMEGTRLGALAMLCAAIADVLAWCALAVVLAMVRAQGPAGVLRTLAFTAALGALCAFGLRPLVRALTSRYAHIAVPDTVRLLAIAGLIIGLAAASDRIGVHAVFGGFLAGIVLPKGNPLLGAAAEQITKLNQAILVPVFFASIGMEADIRSAIDHPVVLAGGALLILAAVAGKLGSAVPVAWAAGMPWRSSVGLGVLMNARGVTEIVVLSIGLSIGVINPAAFTVLVVMALLTTCVAVPALRLLGLDHSGWRGAHS